jgi:hypothetical protein
MARMTNAASAQAIDIGRERLRDFLESSESGRQAMAMSGNQPRNESVRMDRLNGDGKKKEVEEDLDEI